MQGLTVAESQIAYLWECFLLYSEGCAYLAMYVAGLLYLLVRGKKTAKELFLPQALMLLLTVFNPVFPLLLDKVFDVNKEYYRFFWIAPVVIVIAYVLADIVGGYERLTFVIALLLAASFLGLSGNYLYSNGYIKAPNIYKMPSEIPEISRIIHEDTDEEFPRAVFEFDYEMCIRQYDAAIMLCADREAYLDAVGGRLDKETIYKDENYYNRVLAVVALGQKIPQKEFKKGLEETATEYVVVTTASDIFDYLKRNCALRIVGQTANHTVFHYELTEHEPWNLPDYSEVWEKY